MKGNVMDLYGEGWKVLAGSCLDRLPELADESVDAVVCDPPYELGFMGKSWDSSGIAYDVNVWRECLRVVKPGGHVLAFGGSRTWHRLAVAVEDAGFELRDSIAWLYGSGFPKSLDVSKAIDKAAGAEREVLGPKIGPTGQDYSKQRPNNAATMNNGWRRPWMDDEEKSILVNMQTAPATVEAQKWAGWGTALKPAFEPVVVGRKPLKGTVAANVLAYGVGGLNIDGTRIAGNDQQQFEKNWNRNQSTSKNGVASYVAQSGVNLSGYKPIGGRWPSNVILDEYTAQLVDEQQEEVSRFFYIAKANKRDRNEGLENFEGGSSGAKGNGLARVCETCGTSILKPCDCPERSFVNPQVKNFHPTVKPTDLMRQLIRLVTPPGGIVLDPFTGSGSTGKAAILEGMQFIGCELTEDYLPIIQGRINWAVEQVKADKLKVEQKQAEVLF